MPDDTHNDAWAYYVGAALGLVLGPVGLLTPIYMGIKFSPRDHPTTLGLVGASMIGASGIWWGLRSLKHGRAKRNRLRGLRYGLCVNCGYSLHGLTEPRCPECNTCGS